MISWEEALEYDAVELTVLLKSIGFRMISFEFDTCPDPDSFEIDLEINCKRSGMKSKLILNSKKCTCPPRNQEAESNNSYWEIQGREPQTPISRFKGIVKDTSCNLLPDISRKSANIARTMLAIILQSYQIDFSPDQQKDKTIDVKTFADHLNIKMPNTDDLSTATRTNSLPSITENDALFQKSQSVHNLTTNNFDSLPTSIFPISNGTSDGCLNGNNNCDSDKTTDDSLTFPSLSSQKSDGTDINEMNFQFDYEPSEKDKNLVQKILKARKELDIALKLMRSKPSNINIDKLSKMTITGIAATPPISKEPRTMLRTRRSVPALPTGRRSSFGNGNLNENSNKFSPQTPKLSSRTNLVKRDSFKSTEKSTLQAKPTALRRTASGTHLKPLNKNNNLIKGQVMKSNASPLNATFKKI